LAGFRRRYAKAGDLLVVSVKTLRNKRKLFSKTKKGSVLKALILRVKSPVKTFFGESLYFFENSVLLLNKQNKIIASRLFGSINKNFRSSNFFRTTILAPGLID
jgi:large subunit ribosomal protein L14